MPPCQKWRSPPGRPSHVARRPRLVQFRRLGDHYGRDLVNRHKVLTSNVTSQDIGKIAIMAETTTAPGVSTMLNLSPKPGKHSGPDGLRPRT